MPPALGSLALGPPPPAPSSAFPPCRGRRAGRQVQVCCAAAGGGEELREVAKAKVKRAVANTKRGKLVEGLRRREIIAVIEELEALNPTPRPTATSLVSGGWSLLFQSPLTEEAAAGKASTLEGPFLAAFQPFTKGLVRTKRDLQVIDLEGGRVENLAEFVALGIDGSLNILGTAVARDDVKVDVEFTEFQFKLGAVEFSVPLGWVKARGWVETTYVDDELRVGRGDKGSIFVTARTGLGGDDDVGSR
mmetsp:Transcript_52582/g.167183  ORF Transcript_52582/g.167183 Transcript_52582/m.167183 type:complete len:248 (-) Transcript_52582:23-766(-)